MRTGAVGYRGEGPAIIPAVPSNSVFSAEISTSRFTGACRDFVQQKKRKKKKERRYELKLCKASVDFGLSVDVGALRHCRWRQAKHPFVQLQINKSTHRCALYGRNNAARVKCRVLLFLMMVSFARLHGECTVSDELEPSCMICSFHTAENINM